MGSTSNSKKLKLSKELLDVKQDKEEDRISNLPNSLISHILSFLPTKYAVATSVLSSKWEHCWTFRTSLEFDDELHQNHAVYRSPALKESLKESFTCFVYRVLLLCRSSCLHEFHLNSVCDYDVRHINAWVASALEANVHKISLFIVIDDDAARLPMKLFTSRTLVELKLLGLFFLNLPTRVLLPCLKVLTVDSTIFTDDDSITKLLCGCPLLEELSMTYCMGDNVRTVEISAPLLTSLDLRDLTSSFDRENKLKIILKTPLLSDLVISDFLVEDFTSKNLYYINKAHIEIQRPSQDENNPSDLTHSYAVDQIFKAASRVKILQLSCSSMEAINERGIRLPTFERMTDLELRIVYYAKWKVLPQLLEKSPHLRTLTFSNGLVYSRYDEIKPEDLIGFCPGNTVPDCLCYHLKIIDIRSFHGWNEELEMVKYFLETAVVLEKMIIHCPSLSDSDKLMITKKLLMLPRASRCLIELL